MSEIMKTNLAERIERLITEARKRTVAAVNTAMIYTYYEIGRMIVDDEQKGTTYASYGKETLKNVSMYLIARFGKGYSVDNLERMRKFYLIYSNSATPLRNSQVPQTLSAELHFTLSWSHYLKLMRIENHDERRFYEIEATENNWSLRELQRQFDSSLYERLALSRDKTGMKTLAQKGQIVEKPEEMIKDP